MTKTVVACTLAALVAVATAAVAGEQPAPAATAAATTTKKLDVNRASVEELVAVPGIGPRMAQAIVELRTAKGSFRSLDELLQVRGIKEKTLEAIAPYLAVLPKAAAATPPKP